MLTFDEYQSLSRATAQYPTLQTTDVAATERLEIGYVYPALGLFGEAGEVASTLLFKGGDIDSLKKEIGDVLWYISALCKELNITISSITNINEISMFQQVVPNMECETYKLGYRVCIFASIIAENIKKAIRDDVGAITSQRLSSIQKYLLMIMSTIAMIATKEGLLLEEIAQANIDKLASRAARGVIGGSGDNR